MNSSKNSIGKNQLNSNSTLFLQLGIILALIIVHTFFELEFSKKIIQTPERSAPTDEMAFVVPIFELEKKIPIEQTEKTKKWDLTKIKTEDNLFENIEPPILFPDPEPSDYSTDLSDVTEVITDEPDEAMPINWVEQAPRYPGCKGKTEMEFKKCLNDKIVRFVSKKFNSNLGSSINIRGKQKIHVQFEINKSGDITNIKARSPFKILEKEAIRVIGKLPKMTPAKQHKKNVSVKYNLPISFYIE